MKHISKIDPLELTRIPEIIFGKTRMRFTVAHAHNMMKKYGFTLKKSTYVHPRHASPYQVKKFQENDAIYALNLERNGYTVMVTDESQCVEGTKDGYSHHSPTGKRIYEYHSGRRSSVILFGALGKNGEQYFRTAARSNSDTFIEFLKGLECKYWYVAVILDNASWHRSKKVTEFVEDHPDIKLIYLPVGTPELNAVDSCWKVAKKELCSKYYETFGDFARAVSEFFRTHVFDYDIKKYLMRDAVFVQ